MLIKFLSGDYPLHQIILTRSLIGMVVVLAVILPLSGGIGSVRTKRLGLHLLRGFAVVLSNVFFFMALAAMPLAEAVAIFFICPLLISVASVVFLGETVGPRRWAAIGIGLWASASCCGRGRRRSRWPRFCRWWRRSATPPCTR
jgi:drug/metabolite transporter (DMT)-like permease